MLFRVFLYVKGVALVGQLRQLLQCNPEDSGESLTKILLMVETTPQSPSYQAETVSTGTSQ